jgi:hypothetical protein
MNRVAWVLLPLLLGGAGEPPPNGTIVHYCGGGVTGGGGGLRIDPDGTMLRFRRARAGAPVEETALEATAPHARIAAMLDAAHFEAMPRGAPSNMTCSVTRWRDGRAHVVMWGIGRAPAALQPALREIQALGR